MDNTKLIIFLIKVVLCLLSGGLVLKGLINFKVIYDHYFYGKDYLAPITKISSKRHRSGLMWTYHYTYRDEDGFEYEGKTKNYLSSFKDQSSKYIQGNLVNISYLPHKASKSIYVRYNHDIINATAYLVAGITLMVKSYFAFVEWNEALKLLI